jgi:hypothetical protein
MVGSTMRAVVIFESIFGNTKAVAEAIADGLRGRFELSVAEVGAAPNLIGLRRDLGLTGPRRALGSLVGIDLLVVGGPIHAWSLTRKTTRKAAREQAAAAQVEPPSTGIGLREFLHDLPSAPETGIAAAAFDTAIRTSWFPSGSAANPAARRLEAHGYTLLVKPEHFYVSGTEGPLEPGELERARAWGTGLADAYVRSLNGEVARASR